MASSETALPRSQMTTGMTAGMTFMKFARGLTWEVLKPEVIRGRSFTWGFISCLALLDTLATLKRIVQNRP